MNKSTLLEQIYRSKQLNDCLERIDAEIRQDVLQHAFLYLLERDEAFIVALNERGKLSNYVVKVLFNLAHLSRSTFRKTIIKEQLPGELPDIAQEEEEPIEMPPIDKLYWYEAKMLELYAEHKSYRKIEALTGIDSTSVFHTVKKARKTLKKLIK